MTIIHKIAELPSAKVSQIASRLDMAPGGGNTPIILRIPLTGFENKADIELPDNRRSNGQGGGKYNNTDTDCFRKQAHPRNKYEGQGWEITKIADTLNICDNTENRTPILIVHHTE